MSTAKRKGDWMQTFTGRAFWPLDPKPEDFCIEDIAHAHSNQCRFAGHCLRFFSVAEHVVLLSQFVPAHLKKAALMHDSPEAFIVDVPRPLKPFLSNYKEIEQGIEKVMCAKFGLPDLYPPELEPYDTRFLLDEQVQNMSRPPMPWFSMQCGIGKTLEPLGVKLQFWTPEKAEIMFLATFRELFA